MFGRKFFQAKIDAKAYIKTKCGINTFNRLKAERGMVNRLRFIQFVFCAVIVDMFKCKSDFDD